MKYCSKCILSENIFSVTINADGLCNYCVEQLQEKLQSTTMQVSDQINLDQYRNQAVYDVILAYSGGKDSTYVLYLLKEKYKLNVLAATFDNGFLSVETYKNIKNVCSSLEVDSLIFSPASKKLNKIFKYSEQDTAIPKKALERASAVCTYCISLVKMMVYREAILRKIPLISFGWTPGQSSMQKGIVNLGEQIIKANFARIKNVIVREFGESYASLLLTDEVLAGGKDHMPALFYPFVADHYSEEQIVEKIKSFGWKKPNDTDQNSTNCLLNAYAIRQHKIKYGFHPYALELAYLVRNDLMSRTEALDKVNASEDQSIIESIERKLNE